MANEDTGSKTEKPTPHSLREARKKGDIPKSRDIGLTLGLMTGMSLLWITSGYVADRVFYLMTLTLNSAHLPFQERLVLVGHESISTLLVLSAMVLIPLSLVGLLVEFLQVGPILTIEKIRPNLSNLNPSEGFKRMFSKDNLFQVVKSVLLTVLLTLIAIFVGRDYIPDLPLLPWSAPLNTLDVLGHLMYRVTGFTALAFLLVTCVDTLYQHYSFLKKKRMSMQDIKKEAKATEGDPLFKNARREMAFEWSQESATSAAREANVLVVNPTHVAIALLYNEKEHQVPVMSARGEEDMALAMRQAAEKAGTPIIRNELLARKLLYAETKDNVVPHELFDAVAEVIIWARRVKEEAVAPLNISDSHG